MNFMGRVIEELYKIVGLDKNLKKNKAALVELFKKLGNIASGKFHHLLSAKEY
jgi:hypothetical protein